MTEDNPGSDAQPTVSEDEMRRRLAEELKKVKVGDVLVQSVVSLVNLGGQRLGLSEDSKDARDLEQARLAIEAVRVLVPLLDESSIGDLTPIRDALAQLQVAYAREAAAESGEAPGPDQTTPSRPQEPAQKPPQGDSGLWVPPGSST